MQTDELIGKLGNELKPVRRDVVRARLALGLAVGLVGATLVMIQWLGLRPDLPAAVTSVPFWMKLFYTLAIASLGFLLASRAARPSAAVPLALELIPVLVIFGLAVGELLLAAPEARLSLLIGQTYAVCTLRILLISAPLLLGALWAMRGLAPTNLSLPPPILVRASEPFLGKRSHAEYQRRSPARRLATACLAQSS